MENKATNGFVFKKEFEEKEFLRKTFLSFARDSATPEDIIEADFGEPRCETFQALAIGATVDLNYTASIGYTRQVSKEVYNERTHKVETKYEKVTDWHPVSDSYSRQCNGYAENSDNPRAELAPYIAKSYVTTKGESKGRASDTENEAEQPVLAKSAALNAAKRDAELNAVNACKKSLPGDTHKNFSYNGSLDVTSRAEVAIPLYSVDYKYGDNTYTASAFASGEYQRWGKAPERKKKSANEKDKKLSMLSLMREAYKSSGAADGGTSGDLLKMTSIVTGITAFLCMMAIVLPMIVGKGVGIAFFVLASVAIAFQLIALPLIIEFKFGSLLKRKEAALRSQFEKHGLSPLTDEELNTVKEDINLGKKNNTKTNSVSLIICAIFYIAAAFMTDMYILGAIVALAAVAVKAFFYFKKQPKQ